MPMMCFVCPYLQEREKITDACENYKESIEHIWEQFQKKTEIDNNNGELFTKEILELKSRIERLEESEKDYGRAHANDMNEVDAYMKLHDSYLKDILFKQGQFDTQLKMLAPFHKATVDEMINAKNRLKFIESEVLGLHINRRIILLSNRIEALENQNVKEKTD
jgi:hypothetical protein